METYIQMAMVMKLSMLRRIDNPNFTYEHIEDLMYKEVWKKGVPKVLNKAVNDVMSVTAEQVIKFLSKQAIVEAKTKNIDDFLDLLGGNRNESE